MARDSLPKVRYANRRLCFFNNTREELVCINCQESLYKRYLISSQKQRYRCMECSLKLHIIDEIPDFAKEEL